MRGGGVRLTTGEPGSVVPEIAGLEQLQHATMRVVDIRAGLDALNVIDDEVVVVQETGRIKTIR